MKQSKTLSWQVIILVLVLCEYSGTESVTSQEIQDWSCPDTWFVPTGENHTCKCGHTFNGIVSCDDSTKEVGVVGCYCITFYPAKHTTVIGQCMFNCVNVTESYLYHVLYHHVPGNIANGDTNNSVCEYLNRHGALCGKCLKGHHVLAYSYSFKCINCSTAQLRSWPVYIAVAYVPLTVFIIFILLFRVSVVSPKLHVLVSMIQILTVPFNVRAISAGARFNPLSNTTAKIVYTLYGVWNLDFFRTVLPGVCLHLTPLQVFVLDYAIAVYPMIVTVIAFTILELHNCGCKPVMYMWKPFQPFFAQFRRELNLHTSLMDAFITFFILSTTKLIYVSVNLLLNTTLHTPDNKMVGRFLYEDASIEFFGSHHLPYAILAIFVMCLLLFLPICLIFYQFTCCQRCLTVVKLKGYLLDELINGFNQYYKDGRDGSLDCRWFAAFYTFVKIGAYLLAFFGINAVIYNMVFVYLLLCAIVVVIVEPYKEEYKHCNILDPVIILSHALFLAGISALNFANIYQREYSYALLVYTVFAVILPIVYFSAVALWWLCQRGSCGFILTPKALTPGLPDRILHSSNYGSS